MDINTVSIPAIGKSSLQAGTQSAVEAITLQQKEASIEATSQKVDAKELQQQVEQVNSRLEQLGMGVSFSIDESSQSPVIKVIDRSTDEVIKQFPNEESLKRMEQIQSYLDSVQQNGMNNKENLTGVLFNEII
ncbi:MAG TPA: flagellar protein FlaG [Thiomicrorhabdus sp.]|nr:flagellar protein FlaG [Thiomicrorhabdus sp.]